MLAVGSWSSEMDSALLDELCKNKLVFTESVLVEVPIAFPVKDELASGMSSWIHEANRNGITIEKVKDKFKVQTW